MSVTIGDNSIDLNGKIFTSGHVSVFDGKFTFHKPNLVNPILQELRFSGVSDNAVEYLFQLARIWTEWQSPAIGTFPLDWQDSMGGHCDREMSDETGEDYTYWLITDLIEDHLAHGGSSPRREDIVVAWVVHATAVINRYLDIYELEN